MKIRIGSRGSDLALWQAHFVQKQLTDLGHEVSIQIIVTKGDRIQDLSFDKIEGKGFFTKEIEDALLRNEIDLAVHSHKDLETTNPEGLIIGAVSYRENPHDLLLVHPNAKDYLQPYGLKKNAIIGTSAARRKSQLLRLRPDCNIKDLRGNVPTRIQKLREGHYDAIVLAAAGVYRLKLDLTDLHLHEFSVTEFIPAPAQGVLGLQVRESDLELRSALLAGIHHNDVRETIFLEREVMRLLQGGCQLPLGVYCRKENDSFKIEVSYSANASQPSSVLRYTTPNLNGFAEKIVADLKK